MPHEICQRLAALRGVPVQPADLIILAVGIVVTVLGVAEFIPGEQHRRTLREQQ